MKPARGRHVVPPRGRFSIGDREGDSKARRVGDAAQGRAQPCGRPHRRREGVQLSSEECREVSHFRWNEVLIIAPAMSLRVEILSSADQSIDALRRLCEWGRELHLCYAWAGSGEGSAEHWRLLPPERLKRVVLGIHFAQTEPFLLEKLRELGVLRLVPDTGGVFHPKVLLARRGEDAQVLVGSSNFTTGGFASNTELNVLLAGKIDDAPIATVASFISEQWNHPRAFEPDHAWLDDYSRLYASRPRPPKLRYRKQSLKAVSDAGDLHIEWPAFSELIARQERRSLSGTNWMIHVFDHEDGSYLQEIESCQRAFREWSRFDAMPLEQRKLVAGWGGGSRGYIGRMAGAGYFKNLTAERPEKLSAALDKIPLSGVVSIDMARAYLEAAMSLDGVAMGGATRLLTMKRPDCFLPANNASFKKLREVFGKRPDSIDKYLEIIQQVWRFPWFEAPPSDDRNERRIWNARVALLDAIFYEPNL